MRDQADYNNNGAAACRWVLEVGFTFDLDSVIQWQQVLTGSVLLEPRTSSFAAELAGAEGLAHGLAHLLSCPGLAGPTHSWYSSLPPLAFH